MLVRGYIDGKRVDAARGSAAGSVRRKGSRREALLEVSGRERRARRGVEVRKAAAVKACGGANCGDLSAPPG